MMSQISAPCCDSDLNLTSLRVKYGKVTFGNKFSSSLKMFIGKGKKIQLGFDNKYPEIINACHDSIKHGKTVQMSGFISYAAS